MDALEGDIDSRYIRLAVELMLDVSPVLLYESRFQEILKHLQSVHITWTGAAPPTNTHELTRPISTGGRGWFTRIHRHYVCARSARSNQSIRYPSVVLQLNP